MEKNKAKKAAEILNAYSQNVEYLALDLERNGNLLIFHLDSDGVLTETSNSLMREYEEAERLVDIIRITKSYLKVKDNEIPVFTARQIQEMLDEESIIIEIISNSQGLIPIKTN